MQSCFRDRDQSQARRTHMSMTTDEIRSSIWGLDEPVELRDGTTRPLIFFDNAATTPALVPVMDTVEKSLRMYGSIGRGFSQKSNFSTDLYESIRNKILEFTGAGPDEYTCFYVGNTTDGLNKLASALTDSPEDIVLATRMEHHSNDLTWRERCRVIYAETDDKGRIDYDDLQKKLEDNNVKYLCITAASNVTGYVTDLRRAARLAHRSGAKIIVDGAQLAAHRKISMTGSDPEENLDFFVFSAHKMYSPYGGGAVVGLKSVLEDHMPEFYGGGTVRIVADDWVKYQGAPAVYEAGSPNFPGAAGLGRAIDFLTETGFEYIERHDQALMRRLISGLKKLDNIMIYGDTDDISDRVGVVSFNFPDINSHVLAENLANYGGIATRRGAFCAHTYVWRLMDIPEDDIRGFIRCTDANTPGMIRVSFGIYNTEDEVDEFLRILAAVSEQTREEMQDCPYKPEY